MIQHRGDDRRGQPRIFQRNNVTRREIVRDLGVFNVTDDDIIAHARLRQLDYVCRSG
jgi:hypothetical protein